MLEIRKQFPALKNCIYTNTATSGLLYENLLEWRQNHDLDFLIGGSEMRFESYQIIDDARSTVAKFLGGTADEVALVPNFSIGFNFLMEGLPKNSNVMLLATDYPSVNWPVEERGFNIHYAKIDANLEANIREVIQNKKIDVFIFSIVQWVNGILIDLDFIRTLKSEFNDLLIVADGTQFCGMYDFDFPKSGIDVFGASAYKWLLAGYGNGFFMVRESAQDFFSIKSIGSGSVEGNPAKRHQIPFYKYLEPGHLDSLNFGSLKFSMNFLNNIGMQEIHRHNLSLSKMAKDGLQELGLLADDLATRKWHSTIFNIKDDGALFEKLTQNNVVCAQRGDGIRLSFHFYNVVDEVVKILGILKK